MPFSRRFVDMTIKHHCFSCRNYMIFYPPHCSLKSVSYSREMKKMEEVESLVAKKDLES